MTSALSILLYSLAGLLFVHLFWIVWLKWQAPKLHQQSEQSSIASYDYLLVYASQSGQAAQLAAQTAQQLQSHYRCRVLNIQQLQVNDLITAKQILWFVSSYGEGDAPDSARGFVQKMMSQDIDLSELKFAILALGDRRYRHFCQFGQDLNQWLFANKAQQLFDLICVNNLKLSALQQWQTALEQHTAQRLGDLSTAQQAWTAVQLIARERLNHGSQGQPLYRVRLSAADLQWQSGDIIQVQCANADTQIEHFIQQNPALSSVSSTSLRAKNLAEPPLRKENQSIAAWLSDFISLPYREYSVASIVSQGYIELVIRQHISDGQLGLGSGWLTHYAALDECLNIRVRANPTFHFNATHRMILIGNGSGIAGLMSHLHQAEQSNVLGHWLIFGERQQQYDALFTAQLQHWKQQSVLAELDLVYSRDGQAQKYVKDCLIAKTEQLKSWIEQGAAIYVCGSLNSMAKDVDETLYQLLGEDCMRKLIETQRYLRDVYE